MEMADEELRRASCRALNRMKADTFRGLEKRMTPAARDPDAYAGRSDRRARLCRPPAWLKSVMMASYVKRRRFPMSRSIIPKRRTITYWMDTFGLDSEYDYDPVWAKCRNSASRRRSIRWDTDGAPRLGHQQLRLQSSSAISPRAPRRCANRFSSAASRSAFREVSSLSWKAGWLGAIALLRADRPLEEAQPRGDAALQSGEHRSRLAQRVCASVRFSDASAIAR